MNVATGESQVETERQIVQAFRALLKQPLLLRDEEAFGLVRSHQIELQRRFRDLVGYDLVVRAGYARLRKKPIERDPTRAMRVHQQNVHRDRSRPFTRRHYALMCLTLAALDRTGQQTVISHVAENVMSMAREDSIPLNFDERDHRRLLAEAIQALEQVGALALVDGDSTAWVNNVPDADRRMSLYDVNHGVISTLLAARDITASENPLDDDENYPPTEEGRKRRLQCRVARRLVEQPVLYFEDLDESERAYYAAARSAVDAKVAAYTGLHAERRAEGTAMVDMATSPDYALTDLRFPYNIAERQVALLLCHEFAQAHRDGTGPLNQKRLERAVRDIVERYQALERMRDPVIVRDTLAAALAVLERMKLIRTVVDGWTALPALARFSDVDIHDHA